MSQSILIMIVLIVATAITIAMPRINAIHFGFVGLIAYTVPALLALSLYVGRPGERYLYEASDEAIIAMALVWIGFGFGALTWRGNAGRTCPTPQHISRRSQFAPAAAIAAIFLYLFIASYAGPLFFLRDRHDLANVLGTDYTIWSWVVALGLVAAISQRTVFWTAAFFVPLILIAYAGDRTILVVAVAACALSAFQGEYLTKVVRRPYLWAAISLLVLSVFVVKPTYTALKAGYNPIDFLMEQHPITIVLQWEAFVIHEILERVIGSNFLYSPLDAAANLLGQFLIVPSAFGIDSAQFNSEMQPVLFPLAGFGLAYNMWAQWFAMFGYGGCLVGGALYAKVLSTLDRTSRDARYGLRFLFLLGAALTAVYAHRNSIENLAAHFRIMTIAFAVVWGVLFGMSALRYSICASKN